MSFLDRFKKKQDQKKIAPKAGAGLKLKDETKKVEPKSETVKTAKREDTKNAYRILNAAVVTEKATNLSDKGKYAFKVSDRANKIEVAKAIFNTYGVKPVSVNMINMRGKNVRHGRTSGKTRNWKKAIVTLKPGDKIEIYEGV